MQRHEFSFELDAPPEEVWEVFWYRGPDRPQPKDVKTRIEILHPGDEVRERARPPLLLPRARSGCCSSGVGQSWEWLTEVKPFDSWRYDAVGKPLVVTGDGPTRTSSRSPTTARSARSPRSTRRSTRSCGCCSRSGSTRACPATTTRSSPPSTAASPGTAAGRPRRPPAEGKTRPVIEPQNSAAIPPISPGWPSTE